MCKSHDKRSHVIHESFYKFMARNETEFCNKAYWKKNFHLFIFSSKS